jgi:hypothetical protein
MDVDIYHDESKEGGYWHGILVVPRASRVALLDMLASARVHTRFGAPVGVKGMKPGKPGKLNCLRSFMSIGVASMIRKGRAPYSTGRRTFVDGAHHPEMATVSPLNVKFAVLRSASHFEDLALDSHKKSVEITLRIGIKGLLHYARTAPDFEPLCIRSLHVDGHEHYGGRLDEDRILGRLRGELRDGLTIAPDAGILDHTSDHSKASADAYDDCQLLQLTDSLVGGLRIGLTDTSHLVHKERCTSPLLAVYERSLGGWGRMQNSRWGMNFTASSVRVENGALCFEPVAADVPPGDIQASLF